jgi:hypothetical protein
MIDQFPIVKFESFNHCEVLLSISAYFLNTWFGYAIAKGKVVHREVESPYGYKPKEAGSKLLWEQFDRSSLEIEGTTPRKSEDLLSSLADLVSGSADAGTPCILIKGFLQKK